MSEEEKLGVNFPGSTSEQVAEQGPQQRNEHGHWVKGQSGNITGRPRGAPKFRAKCRDIADDIIDALWERIRAGDLTTDELLRALDAFADRGGYLRGDKLAIAEAARWSVAIKLIDSSLPPETKQSMLLEIANRERDALAEAPQELPGRAEENG